METIVSGHELAATHFCKVPGCESEAPGRGRYAGYCTDHRDKAPASNGTVKSAGGAEQGLRDLLALAKRVDKAKAKAEKTRKAANDADRQADELEAEYREAIQTAARSGRIGG